MRSNCSESRRLRSARSVCSDRRPAIWRPIYHPSAMTPASVTISPTNRPIVGDVAHRADGADGPTVLGVRLRASITSCCRETETMTEDGNGGDGGNGNGDGDGDGD